jgi:endonuclease/exonuclease/phosphatase family metal-dependent hydrolase
MPLIPAIVLKIDQIDGRTTAAQLQPRFLDIAQDISRSIEPAQNRAHTAAYLRWRINHSVNRDSLTDPQRARYAGVIHDALGQLYGQPQFMNGMPNGSTDARRHGLNILADFYYAQAALHNDATNIQNLAYTRLRQGVNTLYGAQGYLRADAYVPACRVEDNGNDVLLVIGRTRPGAPVGLNIVQWNLQGYTASENKWLAYILTLFRGNGTAENPETDVMAFQEMGEIPPRTTPQPDTFPDQFGRNWTVDIADYNAGSSDRPIFYQVYMLRIDQMRCKVGMLVAPQHIIKGVHVVAAGDSYTHASRRPALGLRLRMNNDPTRVVTVYSFHALSVQGTQNTSRAIARETDRTTHTAYHILGDFNRTSDVNWVAPPTARIAPAAGPTYPATNPTSRLDYVVQDTGSTAPNSTVGDYACSDHRPVRYSLSS